MKKLVSITNSIFIFHSRIFNHMKNNHMLRNAIIFLMGTFFFIFGAFQLNTNLVLFVFIGITFMIVSVSTLEYDMKQHEMKIFKEKRELIKLSLNLDSVKEDSEINENMLNIDEKTIVEENISEFEKVL